MVRMRALHRLACRRALVRADGPGSGDQPVGTGRVRRRPQRLSRPERTQRRTGPEDGVLLVSQAHGPFDNGPWWQGGRYRSSVIFDLLEQVKPRRLFPDAILGVLEPRDLSLRVELPPARADHLGSNE